MKTHYAITAILCLALAAFGQANADEKELSKDRVPKAVIDAFEKAYPKAKGLTYEEEMFEGKKVYEVEYKKNGKEFGFKYSADGVLLQKEEEIDIKALPDSIVQAILSAHPDAAIKEAEKKMKPDGTVTTYEVEIETAGKEIELELDAGGNILETKSE